MVLAFLVFEYIIYVMSSDQVFRDDYEQVIKEIMASNPRGLGTILKFQYPKILEYIFEMIKFLEAMPKKVNLSTRLWYLFHKKTDFVECPIDGKPILKNVYKLSDPKLNYCSPQCAQKDPKTLAKIEATCMKNHGCKCGFNSKAPDGEMKRTKKFKQLMQDPEYKMDFFKRCQATTEDRYGVKWWTQSNDGKRSCRANGKNRDRVAKVAVSKKRFRYNKILKDQDVEPLFTLDDYTSLDKHQISSTEFRWKCKHCGIEFEHKIQYYKVDSGKPSEHTTCARCPYCYPHTNCSSLEERKIARWMQSICSKDLEIVNGKIDNFKVIKPFQLDILAKDKTSGEVKLAIEYNGSRWHSLEEGKTLFAQFSKTKKCENLGIPLVHIYEDEWQDLEKKKKIKAYLQMFLSGNFDLEKMLDESFKNEVFLQRDKFNLALTRNLKKWKVVEETEPSIKERISCKSNGYKYHVGDCGTLKFQKTKDGSRNSSKDI